MSDQEKTEKSIIPAHAQKVFMGKIFEVYQWEQTLYDGSVAIFEKLKRKDSAGVIPVTASGKILLAYQEQPSLAPFWGLLGGVVDAGETPLQAAKRELLEEAGATATNWHEWFSSQPHSKIIWKTHTYIARNAQVTSQTALEPGEKIEVKEVTFEEFIAIVQQDDFRDSEVAYAVLQALVNPEKLKKFKQLLFG